MMESVWQWEPVLLNLLSILRKADNFCDTVLFSVDGQSVSAHASVLAAASSVLRSYMCDAKPGSSHAVETSLSLCQLTKLVNCIYGSHVDSKDREICFALKQLNICRKQKGRDVGEVVQTLKRWQSEGIMCDTVLQGTDRKHHLVHGCIVAAASPFLKSLLMNARPGMHVIEAGLPGNEISQLVESIYSGDLHVDRVHCKGLAEAGYILGLSLNETVESELNTHKMTTAKLKNSIRFGVPTPIKTESSPEAFVNSVRDLEHSQENSSTWCNACNKSFKSLESARRHSKLHENGTKSKCRFCGQLYSQPYLTVHERKHTGERPFSCTVCDQTFTCKYRLARHAATVHGPQNGKPSGKPQGKFACSECDKAYTTKWHLKRHRTKHTGVIPFSCKHCGKQFAEKYHWTAHEAGHVACSLKCSHCGDSFRTQVQLMTHIAGHQEDRPFCCHICTLTFKTETTLRGHLVTHSEKKHRCSICGQTFRSKKYMEVMHQRIHTGERPLHCSVCDATFANPWAKASHERKHQKAAKEDVLVHGGKDVLVHGGKDVLVYGGKEVDRVVEIDQPLPSTGKYLCSSCSESFPSLFKLISHKRQHFPNESPTAARNAALRNLHRCQICDKAFRQKAQRNMHMRQVHPGWDS